MTFSKLKAELCRIFDDNDMPTKVREKYQMWQQRILKYAAGSKDKVILNIMGEMEAALGDKECDREGKYNFFHQLLQDNIQDFE